MSRPIFATSLFATVAAPLWADGDSGLWAGTVFAEPDGPSGPVLPVTDGLALWLDAADLTTLFQDAAGTIPVTADADPVGQWSDKSGNGLHVTQSTAVNRPAYAAIAQNALPGVFFHGEFGGGALYRDAVPRATFAAPTAASIWIVHEPNGDWITCPVGMDTSNSDNRIEGLLPHADQIYFTHGSVNTERISGTEPAGYATGFHLTELYRSGTAGEIVIDGALELSGTLANAFDTTGDGLVVVGAVSAGGSQSIDGRACEIVVFNRALTSGERADMTAYLMNKWGIT